MKSTLFMKLIQNSRMVVNILKLTTQEFFNVAKDSNWSIITDVRHITKLETDDIELSLSITGQTPESRDIRNISNKGKHKKDRIFYKKLTENPSGSIDLYLLI